MAANKISFPVQCPRWACFGQYLDRLKFKNPDVNVSYHKNTGIILEDYYIKLEGDLTRLREILDNIKRDTEEYNKD